MNTQVEREHKRKQQEEQYAQKLLLAELVERYEFATRIPRHAFSIEKHAHYPNHFQIIGDLSRLPETYCTVDQICVSGGKWYEVIDEERLSRAEAAEETCRKAQQNIHNTCHCASH